VNAQGIDVSHYQSATPPLAGRSFLFAKATQGTWFHDPLYAMHIRNARTAGLVTGGYHWGEHGNITRQVDMFLEAAGDVDLVALDTEHGTSNMTLDEMAAFADGIHAARKRLVGYASEDRYPVYGQDLRWVAHYGVAAPSIPWDFHQYTSTPYDKDQYNGTDAELRALVGGPSMIVPQALGHTRTIVDARIYAEPGGAPIASKMPKGTTLRFFGAVTGWRYCECQLGGKPQYAWLRADETDDTGEPLTVTDGATPDCSVAVALEYDRVTGGSRIVFPPRA